MSFGHGHFAAVQGVAHGVNNCISSILRGRATPLVPTFIRHYMNGKIYIRFGTSVVTSHVYAVVYEPSSGTWQHADADMVAGWRDPAVVVDRTLYVLDKSSETRLMMWQKESRE
ncbi:hypothetical protein L3X38_004584 [Prunus dulcis]|uniref:Uncharacterized protein n=1 Tax=Prunus dulcis TaxID=3755 RepID=A0AAD5F3E7_PRUDU|nr:hypothetical protein L3X38_004584 [Prunus dulcis]